MTPVTKDEPPSKKAKQMGKPLILAGKMPSDMANRQKLPLGVMKDVFRHLPREQQELLRPVCQFWNRSLATRPSHFRQLFKLLYLICEWYDLEPELRLQRHEQRWPDIERSLSCCGHLKDLANELVGKRFIPTLARNMKISLSMGRVSESDSKNIRYLFRNKLSRTTAFPVLHLISHLREVAFDELVDKNGSFLSSVRPAIAKLLLPMRCRNLCIDARPETDIPSLESMLAVVKSEEIGCSLDWHGTDQHIAQMKDFLETFAIDTRHLFKCLDITLWSEESEDRHWTALFNMILEFFSKAFKNSCQIVPRIDIGRPGFDRFSPEWPFLPFSNTKPIRVEKNMESRMLMGGQVTRRAFEYKIGGGPDAKNITLEVDHVEQDDEEFGDYLENIRFLFD